MQIKPQRQGKKSETPVFNYKAYRTTQTSTTKN